MRGVRMAPYDPETHWSRVAQEVARRGENVIAGDDNPYFRYKRRKFVRRFLDTIDFRSKVVLEVGFGPGGNLLHIATKHAPGKLLGADISPNMVALATRRLRSLGGVELTKIDGSSLPYPDRSVDISFTVTVLQHNTDGAMFRKLVQELCRVSKDTIVVMEDIGTNPNVSGEGDWTGRRVDVYKSVFAESGFQLSRCRFLNTKVSRTWHDRVFGLYKRRIARQHHEGDPIAGPLKLVLALPMLITRILDDIFVEDRNLAKMTFHRA